MQRFLEVITLNYELLSFLEGDEIFQNFQGTLNESESPYDISDLKLQFPISYDLSIYKVDNDLEVDVQVDYTMESNCSRCLKPVLEKVHDSSHVKVTKGEVIDDTSDEEVFILEDYRQFPLEELVFSQVITSIPMKSLCENDCKGLCSVCGQDLNSGDCHCDTETQKNQFDVLKGLFKENKEV